MSWHYLQEREEVCWGPNSSGGIPAALLRLIPTVDRSYSRDNETGNSSDSRSGMIFELLKAGHGLAVSMSSREDSPVRTSAVRVQVGALPGAVRDFGLKCSESLRRFGLRLFSRKTARTYVPVGLAPYCKDLTAWGMMHDGVCWELGTSAQIIGETGCGYLPTPTTAGNELSPSMQKWPVPRRLMEWLKILPTPRASEAGRGACPGERKRHTPSLESRFQMAKEQEILGGTSLALREWMMGWPIGWTALKPLATGRSRQWLNSHGIF